MEAHRAECVPCRISESNTSCALNMLRGASFDEEELDISPSFDERIIRQVQINAVRDGLRYWSPAAIGAGIACVALFAALHVAATPAAMNSDIPEGQARNTIRKVYPTLELDRIPEFRILPESRQ